MTYHMKREHLKNWDLQQMDDDLKIRLVGDDEDIYISERSSVTSSNDTSQLLSPPNKRVSPPILTPRRAPHTLRYAYNELPTDGIPAAIQFQRKRKEDKKKIIRKAPPGHGTLAPVPQVKPPENEDNYYPYWYYYKLKNPDWIMQQQRHKMPDQKIPYDSYDPSKYLPQPALTTSPIKPKKRTSKPRPKDLPTLQTNPAKEGHDYPEKTSVVRPHFVLSHGYDNNQQQHPSPRRYVPLKDANSREHHEQHTKRKPLQERPKLKSENEWTEHYIQSIANKQAHDLSNLMRTSNPIVNRTKNPSRTSEKHFFTANFDEIDNHHHHHQHKVHPRHPPLSQHKQSHYHHHHHHHPSSIPSEHNHPTQLSSHHSSQQSHHDDYHQQHLHIRRRSTSGTYTDSDVQIVDILFDHSEPPQPPPRTSVLYNPTHYLPSIAHKANPTRFPAGYYGTLSRQANSKRWQNPVGETKAYKSELHSRYSDHHLHTVMDKRLVV